MPRLRTGRLVAAVIIAATAGLGLVACTGGPAPDSTSDASSGAGADQPGDGGQSTADACALVQQTISDAAAEFSSASVDDPAVVVDGMKAAAQKLGDASAQVTNDQIAALLPPLRTAFEKAADVMQSVADGDVSKLADSAQLSTDIQEPLQAFQEICGQ
jgi:hypothetical protein